MKGWGLREIGFVSLNLPLLLAGLAVALAVAPVLWFVVRFLQEREDGGSIISNDGWGVLPILLVPSVPSAHRNRFALQVGIAGLGPGEVGCLDGGNSVAFRYPHQHRRRPVLLACRGSILSRDKRPTGFMVGIRVRMADISVAYARCLQYGRCQSVLLASGGGTVAVNGHAGDIVCPEAIGHRGAADRKRPYGKQPSVLVSSRNTFPKERPCHPSEIPSVHHRSRPQRPASCTTRPSSSTRSSRPPRRGSSSTTTCAPPSPSSTIGALTGV